MTRITSLVLAAFLVAGAAGSAAAQTIKLGTLAPKGSPWYQIMVDMTDAWGDASDGAVKVRIYPGGAIGDERDMVRKMGIGQLHGAVLTMDGLGMIVPEMQIFGMPMLLRSDAEVEYILQNIGPDLEKKFEARGYKVLNWGDAGWIRLFATKPVLHPEDLRPLKLFAQAGADIYVDAWRELGYQPVPLPVTEMTTALQSGMVESFFTTPVAALSFQWFGQAGHMTDIKAGKMVGATIVSLKVWNRIPQEARPAILKAARAAGRESSDRIREFEQQAITAMTDYGLTVHPVPVESREAWEAIARKSYPVYIRGSVPAALVARVEKLRDEHRSRLGQR